MNPENKQHWEFYLEKFANWKPELKEVRIGCEIIRDPELFISSHLEMIKKYPDRIGYPYLLRLLKYKQAIENKT